MEPAEQADRRGAGVRPLDSAGKAALVLLFGSPGFLMLGAFQSAFGIAILVGVVGLWLSVAWRRRDKVIATAVVAASFALPFVLAATVARDWGFGVLILVLLWPLGAILAGGYLFVVRWPRDETSEGEDGAAYPDATGR